MRRKGKKSFAADYADKEIEEQQLNHKGHEGTTRDALSLRIATKSA
jgi:hypothetical protein